MVSFEADGSSEDGRHREKEESEVWFFLSFLRLGLDSMTLILYNLLRQVYAFPTSFDDSSRVELSSRSDTEIGTDYEPPKVGSAYSPVAHNNLPPEYTMNEPPDVDSLSTYERSYVASCSSGSRPIRRAAPSPRSEVFRLQPMAR